MTAMTMGTVRSKILLTVLVLVMLFGLSNAAWAATTCKLYVDDMLIGTDVPQTEEDPQVYMDVPPEVKNGVSYVPLRFVGELFGAEVNLAWSKVWVTLDDTLISLTIGEKTARVNDRTLELAGASYVKNGRTMVPLRFISEAFGYKVNYANSKIWIKTPPLVIDGKEVAIMTGETHMTAEAFWTDYRGNIGINGLWNLFEGTKIREIEEPAGAKAEFISFSSVEDYYFGEDIYHFVGADGVTIASLHCYILQNGDAEVLNKPKYIMQDEVSGKWYEMSQALDKDKVWELKCGMFVVGNRA